MKAVIVAGGKGTRLGDLSKDTPKALIKIGNKPVIEHQIALLKKYGIKDVWLLLGYLGEQIKEHLGNGRKWGVNIHCHHEQVPLGRTGALKAIESKIKDDFLFLSGDIMMDFDVKKFIGWHKQKKDSIASLVVHPSKHPSDSDLVEADSAGKVISLLLRPHRPDINSQNLSIASVFIFSPDIFKYIPNGKKTDFEKDVLPSLLKLGEPVYAYKTLEYLTDMGTPERLSQVREDYALGKIKKFSLKNKRKAVFLDRDGTINHQTGEKKTLDNFKLYNFSAKAIKKINESDFLAIVITNQPTIAKGFMSENDLFEIHKKMEAELGKEGAKIDAIYYCPHHPEKGFSGERTKLKINCQCRKPKIGLIKKAEKDFNLDLRKCFLIGDSTTDAKTAENAEIKFVGVKTGYACKDNKFKTGKLKLRANLLEAMDLILEKA